MKKVIYSVLATFLLYACGGNEENTTSTVEESTDIESSDSQERAEKAKMVFYTIPSPYETALMFEKVGVGYNIGILNSIDNVNNYSTKVKKALNFGVYGADLSYANLFDQSQQCMFYMNCAKKLADGLGVTSAFDAETMERIEINLNNRDSLMTIINDSYWIADSYLKENEEDYLSALIISGGWIEGLYLGSNTLDRENINQELMQRVADQKYSLNNLIELLKLYSGAEVENIGKQLEDLKASFDKIESTEEATSVEEEDGMATIGGGETLNITEEIIFEIAEKAKTIRNEIIQ